MAHEQRQYGGIIKAGENRLAIFYGLEYNQAELLYKTDTKRHIK
ncbi:hypothetical protein [Dapis sp. BLCC M172]